MKTIKLIRHGESVANSEGRWQGSLDSGLSVRGLDQVRRLGERFPSGIPGRVMASDLGRSIETAAALTANLVPDAAWRECDIGAWEGMTTLQIIKDFPREIEAFFAGGDVAPGGGESMSDFNHRIVAAFEDLVDSMHDGDTVHVVSHGWVIRTLLSHVLGPTGQTTSMSISANTAVSVITVAGVEPLQLSTFNDATHLEDSSVSSAQRGKSVTLFRHGETENNRLKRWNGRTDSELSERGREQATAAASGVPAIGQLYSSPLGRARETAEILGEPQGLIPIVDDAFIEMSFGAWESLTSEEARLADPAVYAQIFEHRIDLPFGGDGETFVDASRRMKSAVETVVERAERDIGVVCHAAVIRAYVASMVGLGFSDRTRIEVPRNTSSSSALYADGEPTLTSYNVAPHLER